MSNSAVGLFISRNLPAYSSAPTQRAAQEIRSRNAPLLAALEIERVLLRSSRNKDQYDHHLARLDVLSSQVER